MQVQAWTTEEGLPQNSVHALLQTPDGYLWVATEKGVARFDGIHFRIFNSADEPAFQSDDVCCMATDASGALYFGTARGVVVAWGTHFARLAGSTDNTLGLEQAANGEMLVLSEAGLGRVANDRITGLALPGGVMPTALGRGWGGSALVAAGSQLYRYRLGWFEPIGQVDAAPTSLLETGPQQLWTATAAGAELWDGQLRRVHRWVAGESLPGTRVESLEPWKGGVLIGTNRGAAVLRAGLDVAQTATALRGNAVLCGVVDREGDELFGTDAAGLMILRQHPVASVEALAGDSVTALALDAGVLWTGTRDAGLLKLRTDVAGNTAEPVRGLASGVVLALAVSAGDVWIGSPEGLDRFQGSRVQHWTAADGLPDDFVRTLLLDSDRSVWVGTRRGLAHLRDGRVERTWTVQDGLPSDVISALLRDRSGALWVGTAGGLAQLAHGKVNRLRAEPSAPVLSLLQTAGGSVWVGSSAGLSLLTDKGVVSVSSSGLQLPIAALVEDAFGNLWLRIPTGLVRVAEAALHACVGKAACALPMRQFGVADGMPGTELPAFGQPVAAKGAERLWFATRRGVAVVTPEPDESGPVPPGVAVEDVVVDGKAVEPGGEVRIGAAQRRLAVTFVGLSLRGPGQLEYRYRLRGFDKDWSRWTREDVADYTNLPAGSYVLQVQARNADGLVSRADAEVSIRVAGPLYRRWWFYVCVAVLLGAAGYGLYWLRVRRVQRDYEAVLRERNRIAREIHDTLAQDFVAVSLQLEVTAQLLQAGAAVAAREQIDATRTLVRDGIEDARSSIWALRASDAGQTLPARLAAMVERVPEASFQVSGAYRSLPPSRERELFRIAKEGVGNAARHAQASKIVVELVYSEDAVLLRVSDDGAGFDADAAVHLTGHYGVRGMQERAAAMGTVLHVRSSPGHGATVEVALRTGPGE